MLSSKEVSLVQSDWDSVVPIADTAATLFYGRLFELDPKLRELFTNDLEAQKRKLMQTIGVAVKGLGNLDALVPALKALGQKHVDYGVKPADYDTVGTALLWTLEQGLGAGFDAEHRAAWTKVYGLLAKTMLEPSAVVTR
jgi:hemoglobin-like flavoprotein